MVVDDGIGEDPLAAGLFADDEKARSFLEKARWGHLSAPACPHCEGVGAYRIRRQSLGARRGLWKCQACHKQFTVTVKTIFHSCRIPLRKCLEAVSLICCQEGVTSRDIQRRLRITYKTAWSLSNRIRRATTGKQEIERGPLTSLEQAVQCVLSSSDAPTNKDWRLKLQKKRPYQAGRAKEYSKTKNKRAKPLRHK